MTTLSRRRFLVLSAAASAAACTTKGDDSANPTGETDPTTPLPELELSKEPYLQPVGGQLRLRFETREARALPVTLSGPAGEVTVSPALREDDLTYAWDYDLDGVDPDIAGLHVVQEVRFEDLSPGAIYAWSVDVGGGQVRTGSFTAPPTDGALRLLWIADTMAPNSADNVAAIDGLAPDAVLHGGDIVYQSSPTDTWVGFSRTFAPVTAVAPVAVTVGNHEFEDMDEIAVMFERLFMPQGDSGQGRYSAWTIGGVRIVHIDTESEDDDPDGHIADQWAWAEAELASVADDDDLRFAIVVMHRPMYTFSKYFRDDPTSRDLWHGLFLKHGVSLVLCGHAHCYEHFVVDGLHYVVDGGGGALLYDPDEELETAKALRPEEVATRQAAVRGYGFTVIDIDAGSGISVERRSASGGTDDVFVVASR